MDKVEKIYNKFQNGDSLTNAELDIGINFFSDLSEKLNKAGPVFRLAANEAFRVHTMLDQFKFARKTKP